MFKCYNKIKKILNRNITISTVRYIARWKIISNHYITKTLTRPQTKPAFWFPRNENPSAAEFCSRPILRCTSGTTIPRTGYRRRRGTYPHPRPSGKWWSGAEARRGKSNVEKQGRWLICKQRGEGKQLG